MICQRSSSARIGADYRDTRWRTGSRCRGAAVEHPRARLRSEPCTSLRSNPVHLCLLFLLFPNLFQLSSQRSPTCSQRSPTCSQSSAPSSLLPTSAHAPLLHRLLDIDHCKQMEAGVSESEEGGPWKRLDSSVTGGRDRAEGWRRVGRTGSLPEWCCDLIPDQRAAVWRGRGRLWSSTIVS
ncbi:hypothetical protein DACRYDRAFT_94784 [Dacryopinax primogenitus]|uniref:Uncharacterized protein n=1 Tax=Dacryopinax primogenitus (strain DJM 731) TaxID=1858805 RepID=M5FVB3_DACPD|nr:uncharacterized protein DACRYDRAFT_94784 [Dacryopinax primogenitus]EJU01726.1 hypothetical protein DACRYDRAFT_94784 [Dacryopinax primogenitus]